MEAKDTVINRGKMVRGGHVELLLEAQAEISFKEGREQEHKVMIGVAIDEGNGAYIAGLRKVVEWIKKQRTTPLGKDYYGYYIWEAQLEAQLKEWGL